MLGLSMLALTAALPITPSNAQAAEKLAVLLDFFINPDHAPLFVSKCIGAYEEQGLDVEFIPPADPNAPLRLVAAGQADLALSYQPVLHLLA
jgi:putative hydroxymethylpyrimidine transport system substrate-binding protein